MPSHHAIPANRDYRHRDIDVVWSREREELQQEAKRVQHASVARYEQRPEVQAPMPFEGEEDLDVQFHDIVPRDCCERRYGHEGGLLERDWVSSGPIVLHFTHPEVDRRTRIGGGCVGGYRSR